jgi:hypothetical protein
MSGGRALLEVAFRSTVQPVLEELGFKSFRSLRWRRGGLEVRVVINSKSGDPYTGTTFTLEFEQSDDGRFEWKLDGRARLEGLLDDGQRRQCLELRNRIASGLPGVPDAFLAGIPRSLHARLQMVFEPADELEREFFMRVLTPDHARAWAELLAGVVPTLVGRAESIDPHAFVLGKRLVGPD